MPYTFIPPGSVLGAELDVLAGLVEHGLAVHAGHAAGQHRVGVARGGELGARGAGKFVVLNRPFAGSKSVLKPMLIPGTICCDDASAFEISRLPPNVMVCAFRCQVSVSSML